MQEQYRSPDAGRMAEIRGDWGHSFPGLRYASSRLHDINRMFFFFVYSVPSVAISF